LDRLVIGKSGIRFVVHLQLPPSKSAREKSPDETPNRLQTSPSAS
jgi:hypothetical protein